MRKKLGFLLILFIFLSISIRAQPSYPIKSITLVVPYPVGGSNDVFARQNCKEPWGRVQVSGYRR
jgi:tripartite-type tricarboxylate transporter receptor subunit TctC